MEIVNYPHPTLRHESKNIKRVDAQLKTWVREMLDLMYAAKGVGLAANQVNLPLRLFVVNPTGEREQADQELVFINPVIKKQTGDLEEQEEGCLSLPELYGPVKRRQKIQVSAYTLDGQLFEGEINGLLARVILHEHDHLDGVLFTDRLSETARMEAQGALDEFEQQFTAARQRGHIPSDEEIRRHLAEIEQRYC